VTQRKRLHPKEGEAAKVVQADCAGGEGDRAGQADPEVETDDAVQLLPPHFKKDGYLLFTIWHPVKTMVPSILP
jgi:hypothetical protein